MKRYDPYHFSLGTARSQQIHYALKSSQRKLNSSGDYGTPGLDRKNAVSLCLKDIFGVTLSSFTTSNKGQNGSFSGILPNGNQISVTNDVNSFSTAGLDEIFYHSQQPPKGRGDIQGLTLSGSVPTKWFLGVIPYAYQSFSITTNYSANDLSLAALRTTQVHELGHTLAWTLGLAPVGTEDPFAGKLEDCVNQKMLRGPK
jgi:hypothetical protein